MRPDWDTYGLLLAHVARIRSLDPRTHNGAYISDKDNKPVSIGYNSPVGGWPDNLVPKESPSKYPFFIHAESNAIIHANRKLDGCTIYITGFSCLECAKLICQSRLKKVVNIDFISHMNKNDPNYIPTLAKMFEWSKIEWKIVPYDTYEEEIKKYKEEILLSNNSLGETPSSSVEKP